MKPKQKSTDGKLLTRMSARGRWVMKLGTFFLVLGILVEDMALVKLAIFALILLPLSSLLSRLNLRRVDYECETPDCTFALKPFEARLRMRNRSRMFQRFTVSVDDRLLTSKAGNWLVPTLPANDAVASRRTSHMLRRGLVEPRKVVLRSTFPFGLHLSERTWRVPSNMVVYPAPLFPNNARQWSEDHFRDPESTLMDQPKDHGEFRSVREFRHGDRLKSIHWRASMRHERLSVREFDPPLVDAYSFVFHSYCPKDVIITQQNFERCMQLLCGFFLTCQERGIAFEFTASFNKWETVEVRTPEQLDDALKMLAVAAQRVERNPERLVQRIQRQVRLRRCFVVSNTPLEQWEHLMYEFDRPIDCVDAHSWRNTNKKATALRS